MLFGVLVFQIEEGLLALLELYQFVIHKVEIGIDVFHYPCDK